MSETKSHTCQCRACKDGTDPQIARRHEQINLFLGRLSEPQRRWHVALMVQEPGSPNHYQLSLITGLDEKTIKRGQQELEEGLVGIPQCRQRRVGGGRLRSEKNPKLEPVLLEIVSPRTAGNPMNGQK